MYLPTVCLWVFLQSFKKGSTAFTSTAVVLHESTRAHVRKGRIVSNEKNCRKTKKKRSVKVIRLRNIDYWLLFTQNVVDQYVTREIQLCWGLRFSHNSRAVQLIHWICALWPYKYGEIFHMSTSEDFRVCMTFSNTRSPAPLPSLPHSLPSSLNPRV